MLRDPRRPAVLGRLARVELLLVLAGDGGGRVAEREVDAAAQLFFSSTVMLGLMWTVPTWMSALPFVPWWPSRLSVTSTLPDTLHERDWPMSKLRNGVTFGLRRRVERVARGPAVADRVLDRLDRGVARLLRVGAELDVAVRAAAPVELGPHLVGVVLEGELGRLRDERSEKVILRSRLTSQTLPSSSVTLRDSGSSLTASALWIVCSGTHGSGSGSRRSGIVSRGSVGASDSAVGWRASWATARLPAVRWRARTRSWIERERRAELERRLLRPAGARLALTAVTPIRGADRTARDSRLA